jgi:Fe-S cluster biogenesis protein NfuA/nitrite reductase/ring-hydroxylating ferredoxin subunit
LRDEEARDRVANLESLLEALEQVEDPAARERSTELVQALVELYGAGLERIVALLADREDSAELAEALSGDELVSHLLLLHDLHPVPLEERVRGALDEVRPYLESHGGDVELLSLENGVVRLRMEGSCSGCPSSTATLKLAIEDAIQKSAPDVAAIEAEGVVEEKPRLLQLEVSEAVRPQRAWSQVAVPALASGESALEQVDGEAVLFLKLMESLYAYRPDCPACGESLEDGAVEAGCITCPGCGRRFDVRRAGRSPDDAELQLEPLPLLDDGDGDGAMKVALGVPA